MHEDGDEEDLEEEQMRWYLQAYEKKHLEEVSGPACKAPKGSKPKAKKIDECLEHGRSASRTKKGGTAEEETIQGTKNGGSIRTRRAGPQDKVLPDKPVASRKRGLDMPETAKAEGDESHLPRSDTVSGYVGVYPAKGTSDRQV